MNDFQSTQHNIFDIRRKLLMYDDIDYLGSLSFVEIRLVIIGLLFANLGYTSADAVARTHPAQ
jgi:hypothetical protein